MNYLFVDVDKYLKAMKLIKPEMDITQVSIISEESNRLILRSTSRQSLEELRPHLKPMCSSTQIMGSGCTVEPIYWFLYLYN